MKSNTVYIALGIAAAAGAFWYLSNRKEQEKKDEKNSPIFLAPSLFPTTKSPVEIHNLPGTLLQPTHGNTGIVPPAISIEKSIASVAQAVQKPQSMKTIELLKREARLI